MSRQKMIVIPPGQEPPGETPFERFDNLMGNLLSAPKAKVDPCPKGRRKAKRTPKRKPPAR